MLTYFQAALQYYRYLDAAYCLHMGSIVHQYVCHHWSPAKTAEPIVMLFGNWTWVGPRNHVIDRGPVPHVKWKFWGSIGTVCRELCKTAVRIEMQFGMLSWLGWSREPNRVLDRDANWHHVANTLTEPSMSGGNTALCQTTSTTC